MPVRRQRGATYSEASGEAPGSEQRDGVGWRRRRDGWTVGVLWGKEGSIGHGCAVVSASSRTAGDECEQNTKSNGFGGVRGSAGE